MRRQRAAARRQWFLHRRGVIHLSKFKLRKIFEVIQNHHSRDHQFLAKIKDTMANKAPWRCAGCRQLRKHTAEFCPVCQLPWQSTIDRSYVHNPGVRQNTYAYWSQDATTWGGHQDSSSWTRPRSKSRAHTPRGRHRSKSANDRSQGEGKGQQVQPPNAY